MFALNYISRLHEKQQIKLFYFKILHSKRHQTTTRFYYTASSLNTYIMNLCNLVKGHAAHRTSLNDDIESPM